MHIGRSSAILKIALILGELFIQVTQVCLLVLAAATVTYWSMSMVPGFNADPEQLNPRVGRAPAANPEVELARTDPLGFSKNYLRSCLKGEFGYSWIYHRPNRELIAGRICTTLEVVAWGLVLAWTTSLCFSFVVVLNKTAGIDKLGGIVAAILICLPSALLSYFATYLELWPGLVIGAILFPKTYSYSRNIVTSVVQSHYVLMARAAGIPASALLFHHVWPAARPALLGLGAVSVNFALGAAVVVEVFSGIPGIGELAWRAAMGRDLPLVMTLTLLVAGLTVTASQVAQRLSTADLLSP